MKMKSLLLSALLLGSAHAATIKIATVSPLSGERGVLGVELKRGTEIAVGRLAKNFKKYGYDVKVVSYDDEANPSKMATVAKDILSDPEIVAVVGAQSSGVTKALAEAIDGKIALISPTSTNDTLTSYGWKNFSRVVSTDKAQSLAAVAYAVDTLKVKTVYAISDNTTYGNGLFTAFQNAVKAKGVKVVGYLGVSNGTQMAQMLRDLGDLKPDLVYFGGTDVAAAETVKAVRGQFKMPFMAGDGVYSTKFTELAGRSAVGVLFSSTFSPPNFLNNARDMLSRYRVAYKTQPNGRAAFAYDAANVFLTTLLTQLEAKTVPTRQSVIDGVRQVKLAPCDRTVLYCPNVTGSISFAPNGERESGVVYMMRYGAALKPEMIAEQQVNWADLK